MELECDNPSKIAATVTLGRILERRLTLALAEGDLRLDQWRLMQALVERPGLLMGEIADELLIPPATTTRLVDDLSDNGLVFRRPAPGDARKALVYLSRTGFDRLDRVAPVIAASLASWAAADPLAASTLSGQR